MKHTKHLILLMLLGIILFSSCTETSDDDGNYIQKYIGVWNVNDQSARINYTITITKNPSNSTEVLMENFANLNSTAIALVIDNSLVIDSQSISSDYTVSGSGSYISSNKLIINFDLNDGIDSDKRIATFTR